MKFHKVRASCALLLAAMLLLTACSGSSKKNGQTFAQAHDSFETKLVREDSDSDPVPPPPEGVFDQVCYPSKVGDLAAYVSSDPGDGQKHPMIIWVVGGWGNGIDDFPWTYPAWDNDQTGSAFWQAGVLTMYPSFRGGNGNPGHYEALFGEVDDIISAYEYAASLPYVDPQRIYLGGHSTGGTRALLAAEYIVNHYETPITVEGLAAYASVSHSSLYRRFMKRFQMSPKRFLLEYRIERACALLASTGHSIQEISNSVGFEDPFYFSRAFKDVKGVSPRQYANQARSGREAAMGEDEVKSPSMI